MDFTPSPKARDYLERTRAFFATHIEPVADDIRRQNRELNRGTDWTRWQTVPLVEALKSKAAPRGCGTFFCRTRRWARGSPSWNTHRWPN